MPYPDFRTLPTRPDLAPLLSGFESLGISCELGLVQRHCEVEQPGLLRFGLIPIAGLTDALTYKLEHVADPAQIRLHQGHAGEWLTTHTRYGFELHTAHRAPEFTEEDVRRKVLVHYRYLAQKLAEDLTAAEKIFVYRPHSPGPPGREARELLDAMSRFGDPILLWVDVASHPPQADTAEWIYPGRLMTGYLDRYADIRFAAGASFEGWLTMLAAARELAG